MFTGFVLRGRTVPGMNLKRFAKWDGVSRFHGDVCKKGSKVLVCVFERTILSSAVVQSSKRCVNYLITHFYSVLS